MDEIWESVCRHCDLPEKDKTKAMLGVMLEALQLFSRKQHDYATVNIAVCGEFGVWTRISDKWARLFSHYRLDREMLNESVEDTWFDLAIYALIGILVRRGKWVYPEEELQALGMLPKENE